MNSQAEAISLYVVILILRSVEKSLSNCDQSIESGAFCLESVDEISKCNHLNESHCSVFVILFVVPYIARH